MAEKNLRVPYKSQWDSDAKASKNDCGATSIAMILEFYGLNVTSDEVFKETGAGPGCITIPQLQKAISAFGFTNKYEKGQSTQRLKGLIDNGIPVIALVHYGDLSSRQDKGFRGGHFFVVVGYRDDGWFINDPNFWGNFRSHGDHHFYTAEEFEDSWRNASLDGNTSCSLLIINRKEETIKDFLISVGYSYPEAHLDVVKTLHNSDCKIKSGEYIIKEDCEKKIKEAEGRIEEQLLSEREEAIKNALREARNDWETSRIEEEDEGTKNEISRLEEEVESCNKVRETPLFKIVDAILKLFTKGGKQNGSTGIPSDTSGTSQ